MLPQPFILSALRLGHVRLKVQAENGWVGPSGSKEPVRRLLSHPPSHLAFHGPRFSSFPFSPHITVRSVRKATCWRPRNPLLLNTFCFLLVPFFSSSLLAFLTIARRRQSDTTDKKARNDRATADTLTITEQNLHPSASERVTTQTNFPEPGI